RCNPYPSPSSFNLQRCWLHSLTPVTDLSQLPGILSFAAYLQLEIYWVYPLHLSICSGVGCIHSPQSLT
ncbi:hypothetical protein ACVSTX_10095, partial [Yersinia enterocolitica]